MGFMIAGLIGTVISTAISTYAAYSQAQAQQTAAKTEASYRNQEAESARQAAAYDERQQRRRMSLLLGKQSAIMGASGADPTTGSPLLMELDSVRQAELDALNIRRTGEVSAYGSEMQARNARQRAAWASSQKGLAVAGGVASGASSILAQWGAYSTKSARNPQRNWGTEYP